MKKNSLFTIIMFVVIIGILALCAGSFVFGLKKNDNKEPAAITPTITTPAESDSDTETPDSDTEVDTENTDAAKKGDKKNTDGKTTNDSQSSDADKTDSKDSKKESSNKTKADATKAPANNSGTLSNQEATGEDNVISFDDFQ